MNTSFARSWFMACLGACLLCVGLTLPAFSQDLPEEDGEELDEPVADDEATDDSLSAADEDRREDIYAMESMAELDHSGAAGIEAGTEKTSEHAEEHSGGVGVKVGIFSRDDGYASSFGLVPVLDGWIALGKHWALELDWGFALRGYSPEQGDGTNNFVVGNPMLQALRKTEHGRTSIAYGFGLTVPVYYIPAEDDHDHHDIVVTYALASAMEGEWNHWMWLPEHVTMVVPVEAHMVSKDHILLGGETALALSIPAGDYEDHSAELYWQIAGEIGFGWEGVETGVRLQGFTAPMHKGDKLQLSFGPFVHLELEGGHLGAELLLNLDDPYGVFGSAGDDVWGLFLGGGIDF